MGERRLRPLGLGDIFDEGFDLYKRNFTFLVLVTAVVTVPLDIAAAIVRLSVLRGVLGKEGLGADPDSSDFFSAFGQIAVFFVAYSLVYAIPLTALASAASTRYLGVPETLRQAYRAPLRRLPSLLLTSLLYGFIGGAALLFCVVPFVFPAVLFVFTAQTFAVEGKAYFKALGRSSNLVSGYGGRVFSALVLLILVYFIIAAAIEVPLGYAFDKLLLVAPTAQGLFAGGSALHTASLRRQIVDQVSNGIADLIATPFLLAVITVLYYDLRVRKEAFDIELLAKDLGYAPLAVMPAVLPAVMPPMPPPRQSRGRSR
jgi:hypothetical protein